MWIALAGWAACVIYSVLAEKPEAIYWGLGWLLIVVALTASA
jgi:hypothetical protein